MTDNTFNRILEAADSLFTERGYDGASVKGIAREAGVNKALIFYHFGSKDELYEAVLERYYAAHRDVLEAALAADVSSEDRLHGLVDTYFDFIMEHRRYPKMVQQQVASGRADMPIIRENLGTLLESVEHAVAGIAPKRGPTAARHLFVTFSGAVINYFTYAPALAEAWESDPLSDEALLERRDHLHWLVDILLEALERS